MGSPWWFQSAGRMVFGVGALRHVGEVLAELRVRHCMVISDPNLADHAAALRQAVGARGIACESFAEGEPEPTIDVVRRAALLATSRGVDGVIGLGGGSNIDVAKAVAILLAHGGAITDYAGSGNVPGPLGPLVAVPTTAGSGSEVSAACILSVPGEAAKLAVVDNHLRPAAAVIDPELHLTCPRTVTRDAGVDAFCHAIEAYTIVEADAFPHAPAAGRPVYQGKHPIADTLAERAIQLISAALPRAVSEPRDLEARTQMALGALLAGLAMSNTGIYTVHALSYPVATCTQASHGACNGALLPAVLDFVAPARRREMQHLVGLMGSQRERASDAVRDLLRQVGAPSTLRELGVAKDQLGRIAQTAIAIRRLMDGSPRHTSLEDLMEILAAAYGADS